MRLIFLLTLSLILLPSLRAQDETPRPLVIGGGFSFTHQTNAFPSARFYYIPGPIFISNTGEDSKSTSFAISPYIGKTLSPHVLAGIQLGLSTFRYSDDDAPVFPLPDPVALLRKSSIVDIGLFARYTFNPGQTFGLFVQPSAAYAFQHDEEHYDGISQQEVKIRVAEFSAGAGLLYQLTDHTRLTVRTGGISFATGHQTTDNNVTRHLFSVWNANFNLSSLYFGLEILL